VSDFNGIRVALSSLYAQRRALDVVGQNIANVNTEGYSRQRVEMEALQSPASAAVFSRFDGAGMGVKTSGITRMRDAFMDLRGYQEHAVDAGLRRSQNTLSRIELAFGEPSDTGLAAVTADFLAAWDDVGNRPDDLATRAQLVEQAMTLTAGFAQLDSALTGMRDSAISELSAVVSSVNANAKRVADLNAGILAANQSGFPANELMDQRDRILGELAEQVGVTVRTGEDGTVDVFVGGTALVRSSTSQDLEVEVGSTTVGVKWADHDYSVSLGGDAGGLLTAVNETIPYYRAGLDAVAQRIHDDVNAVHSSGYAADGTTTGTAFFVMSQPGPPPTGLAVNPAIVANPRLVAAAGAPGSPRDGSLAQRIAALGGGRDDYEELVVGLGIEAQAVNRRVDVQSSIVNHVDDAREAAAGVNIDEEMTSMIGYQRAYEAAARYLTAVDETLNTLINSTGLVGR
jgi:flagellar hook-associated protein 1 FlgK